MTYDQFWNDDVELVKFYREANRLKKKQKNEELWLQGLYIYDAFCDVSPLLHAFAKEGTKAIPYREEPYGFFDTKKERKAKEEAKILEHHKKMAAKMDAWMKSANKQFEKKGGEENGS